MLRRSFLQLMATAVAVPALSQLDPIGAAFSPMPVLAVETVTPYWLLELQAYERFIAQWAPLRGTVARGAIPRLPAYPLGERNA